MRFDDQYYSTNAQDRDRPALIFYNRLWSRYLQEGPVLEFGCGVGYMAKRLTRKTKVFGYEINEYARNMVKNIAPEAILINSLEDLENDTLGSKVSLHVLEHIDNDSLELIGTTFKRILRPGGKLLVVMPNTNGDANNLKGQEWSALSDPTHLNLKSATEWTDLFVSNWKMRVIKKFSDGFYDFPYERSWINIATLDLFRLMATGAQFLLGRPLLPENYGENIVFILENDK